MNKKLKTILVLLLMIVALAINVERAFADTTLDFNITILENVTTSIKDHVVYLNVSNWTSDYLPKLTVTQNGTNIKWNWRKYGIGNQDVLTNDSIEFKVNVTNGTNTGLRIVIPTVSTGMNNESIDVMSSFRFKNDAEQFSTVGGSEQYITNSGHSDTTSIEINGTGGKYTLTDTRSLPTTICWWQWSDFKTTTSNHRFHVRYGDVTDTAVIYFYPGAAGYNIKYTDVSNVEQDSGVNLYPQVWTPLCLDDIDWGADTYDVWHNGTRILDDITMRQVDGDEDQLVLNTLNYGANSGVRIDDLVISNNSAIMTQFFDLTTIDVTEVIVAPSQDTLNISTVAPDDLTEFTTNTIDFNASTNSSLDFNVTLFINSTANETKSFTAGTEFSGFQKILSDGAYSFFFQGNNTGFTNETTATRSFTIDSIDVNQSSIPNINLTNEPNINFNITVNSTRSFNCTLNINGTANQTGTGNAGTNVLISLNQTFVESVVNMTHNWNCSNGFGSESSPNQTITIDISVPTITTNFVNNTKHLNGSGNLTGQFNLTDDVLLHTLNVTIDGSTIFNVSHIHQKTFIYNLSEDISNLTLGNHTLNIRVADGHTAQLIPEYNIDTKLTYRNKLRYEFNDQDNFIEIRDKELSAFDEFTTTKLRDRYTFNFEPTDKTKTTYKFEVNTREKLYLINAPDTKYKKWLVSGDKWIDFYTEFDQYDNVDIRILSDTKAEVTLTNVKLTDGKILFSSIGDLNIVNQSYIFHLFDTEEEFQTTILTGINTEFVLNITGYNETLLSIPTAIFTYNGTLYNVTGSQNGTRFSFTQNIIAPDVAQNQVVQFQWNYTLNGSFFNTTEQNQTVLAVGIDNCSSFTSLILNFSVYDETTKSFEDLTNVSIETDINISFEDKVVQFNGSINGDNLTNLAICLGESVFNFTNITTNLITRYRADDHAVEFYYLQNVTLTDASDPSINLYTLNTDTTLAESSTSFLINYQNENFQNVNNAIIDLLRYYIGEGKYLSVEHAQTDDSGNTRLHFVTEDIKYRVIVRKNNEILYQSTPFLAICQDTPCQINFQERDNLINTWNYTETENLIYSITLDQDTRTATANFATIDGTTVTANLQVTRFDSYLNETVCNDNLTSSAGSIICIVPLSARNTTYVVQFGVFRSPLTWVSATYFNLNPNALDNFGQTSVIMTILLTLTLVLMAVPSGIIATIVFGILGLIVATLLSIFSGGSIFGFGSILIWLIVAGGILIWKASKK